MSQTANVQDDVLTCPDLSEQIPFTMTLKRPKQQILTLQNLEV